MKTPEQQTQEQQDLTVYQEKYDKICRTAFSGMRDALRRTPNELKLYGYKTVEEGAIAYYRYCSKKIDKLTEAYLKKYPETEKP